MIVAQIISTIILFIIFAIIFGYIGYQVFNNIEKPKEKDIKIDKLIKDNTDLSNSNQQIQLNIQKIESANINNYQWYINQLYHIGTYLKVTYDDKFVFDQITFLTGQKAISNETQKESKPHNPILNLDKILEKILSVGYTGLTEEEKNFLNKESKNY